MTFKLIDESVTNGGFWVKLAGIDLTQFEKNPIMYFQHIRPGDYENSGKDMILPIGSWQNIRQEGGAILADPVFDEADEFAQKIKAKVERGVLKMASAGLRPLSWDEDPNLAKPGQTYPTLVKSIMLEASIVDRGLNNNALRLYDDNMKEISLADAGIPILKKQNHKNKKEMDLKKIAKTLNLADDAGEDLILGAIQSLRDNKTSLEGEVQTLKDKVKAYEDAEAETRKAERDQLILKAVEDRKITAGQKEHFEKLFDADYESTKALLDSMPSVKRLADVDQKDEKRKDWSWKDYSQKDPAALQEMKDNDPENYKRLFKEEFGKEPNL